MQIKQLFVLAISLMLLEVSSLATEIKNKMSFGVDSYQDNADVQVYSPTLEFYKKLSSRWMLGLKMRIDVITAASIRNGSDAKHIDAVTAASAKEGIADDVRIAPTAILTYEKGNDLLSFGAYYSGEVDYQGQSLFVNYVRQLNEQNTALGIGVSQSFDKWESVFQRALPKQNRNESKVDLSVNQLITQRFSMQAVYSYMYSEGFLSSPYHYALQDAIAKFENYPNTRTASAFALKGVYLLNKNNSVNFSYRYYMDDWAISSHTLNGEILHDFSRRFTSGLRLRYYMQTASYFAKQIGEYSLSDQYYAIDYRMSTFDSFTVGIPFIYKTEGGNKVTASVDYYQTTDNAYIMSWYNIDKIQAIFTTLTYEFEY